MRLVLVGGGQIVYFLTRQMLKKGSRVTIINQDPEHCKELSRRTKATVILGNGTLPKVLEEADIRRTDVLVALTPYDQDNLISCQLAQKIYGVPRTAALVNDPENEAVFRQLGVDIAFSAARIISIMIEQRTTFDDITALMPLAEGKINVTQIHLPPDAPVVGKKIQDIMLVGNTLIACIIRGGEVIVPRGYTQLQGDDFLLIISDPETEAKNIRLLHG